MMKQTVHRIAAITVVLLGVVGYSTTVYGQDISSKPVPQKYIDEIRMVDVRDRALFEAESRSAFFVMLAAKLKDTKRITPSQRSELVSQVQSQIANLNAIKTNLKHDTTAAEILTRRQTIALSYRSYLFLGPKVLILAFADRAIDLAAEIKTQTTDPTAQSLLADADTKAKLILNSVGDAQFSNYAASGDTFIAAQKTIAIILQDLQDAKKTIR
ncbi:hypothetical protein HYS00_00720 [Candidatus Microgenomates bacterium]|nr:hypothetical protein [Candidatus Microgenomates bacterium]